MPVLTKNMAVFQVLHEDDELLVINKPAGLVCHPTKGDVYSSLISRARLHLGPESSPQLINRLDRETGGVILVGKQPAASRELRLIWEKRAVTKEYLAIVHGHLDEAGGMIEAALGRDEASVVAIKDCVRADGARAATHFTRIQTFTRPEGEFSLLRVSPVTGRKHQIRIHMAHIGHPIVGDKLYGGDENLYLAFVRSELTPEQRRRLILPYHALHAERVQFIWRNQERVFKAGPEEWFDQFWQGAVGIRA